MNRPPQFQRINEALDVLSAAIIALPEAREKNLAMQRLEECSHWLSQLLSKEVKNAQPSRILTP